MLGDLLFLYQDLGWMLSLGTEPGGFHKPLTLCGNYKEFGLPAVSSLLESLPGPSGATGKTSPG